MLDFPFFRFLVIIFNTIDLSEHAYRGTADAFLMQIGITMHCSRVSTSSIPI
jgi:hypothetical protein